MTDQDRVECIKKFFRLDYLNQDKYKHVEKIIKSYAGGFQIPGELIIK